MIRYLNEYRGQNNILKVEEKTVSVTQTESVKKTRKLKKPSVEVTNGEIEEGMA